MMNPSSFLNLGKNTSGTDLEHIDGGVADDMYPKDLGYKEQGDDLDPHRYQESDEQRPYDGRENAACTAIPIANAAPITTTGYVGGDERVTLNHVSLETPTTSAFTAARAMIQRGRDVPLSRS